MRVLHAYDSDHKYPFYGFGAEHFENPAYFNKDCFPLNGDPEKPFISGIDELLKHYE